MTKSFFETMSQQAEVKVFRVQDPFGATSQTPYGAECLVGDLKHHNRHVNKASFCTNTRQSQFVADQVEMYKNSCSWKGTAYDIAERRKNDDAHHYLLGGIKTGKFPLTTITYLDESMKKNRAKRRRQPSKYAPSHSEAQRVEEQVKFHNLMIKEARSRLVMELDKKHAQFKVFKAQGAFPFAPVRAKMPSQIMKPKERRKHKAYLDLIDVTKPRPIPKHFHAPPALHEIDSKSLEKIVSHTLYSSNPEVAAMISQHTANRLPKIANRLGLDPSNFKPPRAPTAPELPSIIRHLEFGRRPAPCITSAVNSSAHVSSGLLLDCAPPASPSTAASPFTAPASSRMEANTEDVHVWAKRRRSVVAMGDYSIRRDSQSHMSPNLDGSESPNLDPAGASAWDELTDMWRKMQQVMRGVREEACSLLTPTQQARALLSTRITSHNFVAEAAVLGLARHVQVVMRGSSLVMGDARGDTGEEMSSWWIRRCCKQLSVSESNTEFVDSLASDHRALVGGKQLILDHLLLELDREVQVNATSEGSGAEVIASVVSSVFALCDEVAAQQAQVLDVVDAQLSQQQRAKCVRDVYTKHHLIMQQDRGEIPDQNEGADDEWSSSLSEEQRERMSGLRKELSELDQNHRQRVQQLLADLGTDVPS